MQHFLQPRKRIKNKGNVTLESFPNFGDVSNYLHLKCFAWNRDYVISQKKPNATDLIKAIVKSSCRVLLDACNLGVLFVKGRWVLSNFWHLIYHNFCYIFRKIARLYFLEVLAQSLKTRHKSYPWVHLLRRNSPLKNWKFYPFWRVLFQK